MRSARIVVAAAVATTTLLVASPAQARHTCGLDDPVLNAICESHLEQHPLWEKLVCLVSPSC